MGLRGQGSGDRGENEAISESVSQGNSEQVYNFLPSISAVTGVSPQRYLWRVAVALHISPRLLVAWVARAYYNSLAAHVPAARRPAYLTLVAASFYLNLTELATLCGVTYISNKENYPVHEKLFTLFMLVSLVYMLCVIRVLRAVKEQLSPRLLRSFAQKKWLFGVKLTSTGGLLFFFWRHRVYCQPMAFSWFSLCEYVIATCNMLYHVSVALDFSEEHLIVGHIISSTAALASSASTNSISTAASSSHRHSVSTCESLATCEGGATPTSPPTRNGRLDEALAAEGSLPATPQALPQPVGVGPPAGKAGRGEGRKPRGGGALVRRGRRGPGGGGGGGAAGCGAPSPQHHPRGRRAAGAARERAGRVARGRAGAAKTSPEQRKSAHARTGRPRRLCTPRPQRVRRGLGDSAHLPGECKRGRLHAARRLGGGRPAHEGAGDVSAPGLPQEARALAAASEGRGTPPSSPRRRRRTQDASGSRRVPESSLPRSPAGGRLAEGARRGADGGGEGRLGRPGVGLAGAASLLPSPGGPVVAKLRLYNMPQVSLRCNSMSALPRGSGITVLIPKRVEALAGKTVGLAFLCVGFYQVIQKYVFIECSLLKYALRIALNSAECSGVFQLQNCVEDWSCPIVRDRRNVSKHEYFYARVLVTYRECSPVSLDLNRRIVLRPATPYGILARESLSASDVTLFARDHPLPSYFLGRRNPFADILHSPGMGVGLSLAHRLYHDNLNTGLSIYEVPTNPMRCHLTVIKKVPMIEKWHRKSLSPEGDSDQGTQVEESLWPHFLNFFVALLSSLPSLNTGIRMIVITPLITGVSGLMLGSTCAASEPWPLYLGEEGVVLHDSNRSTGRRHKQRCLCHL
ncbi:LOW QUALITY PROTEIN: uncharacterized protein LOC119579048 [Penaeus monodon]|uniref:LOW QUALITY PROTEIN: uncharacterized protein LOC119579048 n=1 Tax=Penaeus monodon TaxID=6687 RepID=UPI0018A7390B|nr:LOW QUALITY PROTEIN: uncharacterized protein LOC119579048 [Penaeus monodon]